MPDEVSIRVWMWHQSMPYTHVLVLHREGRDLHETTRSTLEHSWLDHLSFFELVCKIMFYTFSIKCIKIVNYNLKCSCGKKRHMSQWENDRSDLRKVFLLGWKSCACSLWEHFVCVLSVLLIFPLLCFQYCECCHEAALKGVTAFRWHEWNILVECINMIQIMQ